MEACVDAKGADPKAHAATGIRAAFGLTSLAACLSRRVEAIAARCAGHAKAAPPRSVGMFHQLADSDGVIVGRNVAVEQLVLAFASRGQIRYTLFTPEDQVHTLRSRYAEHQRLAVLGHDALHTEDTLGEQPEFIAWHEPQFLTHEPFAVRAKMNGRYPITLGHHSLSYRELLHDRFLPLLLAKPRSYDSVICTSAAALETTRRLLEHTAERFNSAHATRLAYAGRLDHIPLPIDTERFRPRDRAAARASFGLRDDAFILLWIGRLSAIDKADLLPLVQVLARLSAANASRQIELICAGRQRKHERAADSLHDYAQQLGVGDRLRIIDDLKDGTEGGTEGGSEGSTEQLYSAADVFVSPSDNLQESYGITPIEAMACGLPQVVSDWNGYRDSVVDTQTGFLIPSYWATCHDALGGPLADSVRDHLVMAQAVALDLPVMQARLQQLLDQPELRRSMAEASRKRVIEQYGFTPVVARYEALWAELAEEAQAAPPADEKPSYRDIDYGAIFSHYPSTMLDPSQVLRLSSSGLALARGDQGLPLYYNARWKLFDESLLRRIVQGVFKMHEKDQGVSLQRMIQVIGKSRDGLRDTIIRHAMWLLKQGFLERDTKS
jgi:glycosyltransferase involved in cell wall biosynthesis